MEWDILMAITAEDMTVEHFKTKDDSEENSDEDPGRNFV